MGCADSGCRSVTKVALVEGRGMGDPTARICAIALRAAIQIPNCSQRPSTGGGPMMTQKKTEVLLDAAQRERLARLANLLIPGGHGLPSASEAEVHQAWVDRTLAVRPDLADAVVRVV